MAQKVRIWEIARRVGISSRDLIEICQRAGYNHIKSHSNAVSPEEAEQIRKTAIKLYRPKEQPPARKAPPAKKRPQQPATPTAERPKKTISTAGVRPVAPPAPPGRRAAGPGRGAEGTVAEAPEAEERMEAKAAKAEQVRKGPRREAADREAKAPKSTTRTVIFRRARKPVATQRKTSIELTLPVSVRELSEQLGVSASELIRRLMLDHHMRVTINETLEQDIVELLGLEYGVEITFKTPKTAEDMLAELIPQDRPEQLRPRPPVVTLLGHVDHGKTSILDRIRNTRVAEAEDGGITQDIGAWQIQYEGKKLTFVDTPGHEAFTAMRARGAQVTDVVILVVAADDGVMAQTEEAISHARAANVPIVVAINKVDKPDANPSRVMQQLVGHGLNPEQWGGETGCVEVSALTGQGIEELLERVLLEAEMLELKANPDRPADGVAIEARMVEGLGVVANLIVRNGTLRKGDVVVCGPASGRVRSLRLQHGEEVTEAGPSTPVAMSGLDEVPEAGDKFVVVADLEVARQVAESRRRQLEQQRRTPRAHVTLENLYESLAAGKEQNLRLVLKADAKGSLEPLMTSLQRIGTQEVRVQVLHQGIGSVNVSDVLLADASDAVILAFRVAPEERARALARERGVQIRTFRVIYEAVQAVRDALEGLLAPEMREERLGLLEVRRVFRISRTGNVAGCYVREGSVRRGARVRLLRDGVMVHEGAIASLRREKNDVREVETGYECGLKLEGYDDVRPGDLIECYTVRAVKRVLS